MRRVESVGSCKTDSLTSHVILVFIVGLRVKRKQLRYFRLEFLVFVVEVGS